MRRCRLTTRTRTYLEHPPVAGLFRLLPRTRTGSFEGNGRPMLTRKQHELLVFIDRHLKPTGFSPSFEEMKDGAAAEVEIRHPPADFGAGGAWLPQRRHHRARALEVVRLPGRPGRARSGRRPADEASADAALRAQRHPRRLHRAPARRARADEAAAVQLPLYGRIAAGMPIEALRDSGSSRRGADGHAGQRRALRAGGRRRFDGRRRHPGRRHRDHPQDRHRRERRRSSSRWWTTTR